MYTLKICKSTQCRCLLTFVCSLHFKFKTLALLLTLVSSESESEERKGDGPDVLPHWRLLWGLGGKIKNKLHRGLEAG